MLHRFPPSSNYERSSRVGIEASPQRYVSNRERMGDTANFSPYPHMAYHPSPSISELGNDSIPNARPYARNNFKHPSFPTPSSESDIPSHSSQFAQVNQNWISRLSMGMLRFARTSITFLGGESEDPQPSIHYLMARANRKPRKSRYVFWNPNSGKYDILASYGQKLFHCYFWKNFFQILLTSTRKKLIASFIFVALAVAAVLCLGTSLFSIFSAQKQKFESIKEINLFNPTGQPELTQEFEISGGFGLNETSGYVQIAELSDYLKHHLSSQEGKIDWSLERASNRIEDLKYRLSRIEEQNKEYSLDLIKKDQKIIELQSHIYNLNETIALVAADIADSKNAFGSIAAFDRFIEEKIKVLSQDIKQQISKQTGRIMQDVEKKLLQQHAKFGPTEEQSDTARSAFYTEMKNSIAKDFQHQQDLLQDLVSSEKASYQKHLQEAIQETKSTLKEFVDARLNDLPGERMPIQTLASSKIEADLNELKRQFELQKFQFSCSKVNESSVTQNLPLNEKFAIIQGQISDLYSYFLMDTTAQVDWALQSLGAKVVYAKTSAPLNTDDWFEFLLNTFATRLPSDVVYGLVKPMGKPADVVLQPAVHPGECFAFAGSYGNITIHLPATIRVTSVALEHVHSGINNNPGSTPRRFKVYGMPDPRWPDAFLSHSDESTIANCSKGSSSCLDSLEGKGAHPWSKVIENFSHAFKTQVTVQQIGDFYFNADRRIETYPVEPFVPVNRITFSFTENYGSAYTCVYRLRVHGEKMQRKRNYI